MNSNHHKIAGYPGEDLIQIMLEELDRYKKSPKAKAFIIQKKSKLISELYFELSSRPHLSDYSLWVTVENEIEKLKLIDPEIGLINIKLQIRLDPTKEALISITI